jgi:hypothetical protein
MRGFRRLAKRSGAARKPDGSQSGWKAEIQAPIGHSGDEARQVEDEVEHRFTTCEPFDRVTRLRRKR